MDLNKNFSVIIPVYNGEKTIGRALASLISNADYIQEVLVVDDHSTDNTIQEVEKYAGFFPIGIYSSDGYHNPGMARRTGILQATGEWITFLDADDCLTPSSLRYVSKHITDGMVLLHTQTIYYESGSFVSDNIGHADNSCGGNFYKKDYLIEHNLLPHTSLRMAEDEYFNSLIKLFIEHVDKTATYDYYDYPVYEVHHDLEDGKSFALSNWVDYIIKYHLMCQEYLTEALIDIDDMKDVLKDKYELNFMFSYYMLQGLLSDSEEDVSEAYYRYHFGKALKFYEQTFGCGSEDIIEYYLSNPEQMQSLKEGAENSVGIKIDSVIPINKFLKEIRKDD